MSEIKIELGNLTNSCFVVMPFDPLYQSEYEKVINPALQELQITCVRGDEIYTKQRIVDDIWCSIRSCRFVIAELTGRNPNVLYEVGLAHAIGKPVIILTRNSEDVPFDLKDLRYLYYDINNPQWGDNLKTALKELISKVIENPTIDTYLEGITRLNKGDFPAIKNIVKQEVKSLTIDIAGTWVGKFNIDIEHEIILEISQKNTELFATAVITYDVDTDPSIVQQNMSGSIEFDKVHLIGVSYTFVKRGAEADYTMDTFELVYNDSNATLSGKVLIDENIEGTISLKRKDKIKNTKIDAALI